MDTTESRSFAARRADLVRNEQHAMADFLVALADFDRQRGWIELGHSGLFAFLHREMGLSKSASFSRMTAAGLIHIPVALGGTSSLANVRLLCASHNKWAARRKLGHGLMNRYCRDPRQPLLAGLLGDASGG